MYSPSNSSFLATSFSLLKTTRGTCGNDSGHLCHGLRIFGTYNSLYNTKNVRPNITLESPTGRSMPRQPLSNGHLGSQAPTLPYTSLFIAEHDGISLWLVQVSCAGCGPSQHACWGMHRVDKAKREPSRYANTVQQYPKAAVSPALFQPQIQNTHTPLWTKLTNFCWAEYRSKTSIYWTVTICKQLGTNKYSNISANSHLGT